MIYSVITQAMPFLPLAFAIGISYRILQATDLTLDGSFVLGAGVFARLITQGYSPVVAAFTALIMGAFAGILVSLIQRKGKIDALLAGILATFILASANLAIMGKPNINLLSETTLLSSAFARSDNSGWLLVATYIFFVCGGALLLLKTRFGIILRALGDNPKLLARLNKPVELYRAAGFAFTNSLAAVAGILTAQINGYADINMGFGMTLTGIGAILLGHTIIRSIAKSKAMRMSIEFLACLVGVLLYFLAMNMLLRFDVNPVYLKMVFGLAIIFFLRTAMTSTNKSALT